MKTADFVELLLKDTAGVNISPVDFENFAPFSYTESPLISAYPLDILTGLPKNMLNAGLLPSTVKINNTKTLINYADGKKTANLLSGSPIYYMDNAASTDGTYSIYLL